MSFIHYYTAPIINYEPAEQHNIYQLSIKSPNYGSIATQKALSSLQSTRSMSWHELD
jgi:hypothetical protein